jgi:hypothetical protein
MQHESRGTNYCRAVSVYVEDIGVVSLSPRCLSPLD